jgi:hypothetical protein
MTNSYNEEEISAVDGDVLLSYAPRNAPPISRGGKLWLRLDYADSDNWVVLSEYPNEAWDYTVILEVTTSQLNDVSFNKYPWGQRGRV